MRTILISVLICALAAAGGACGDSDSGDASSGTGAVAVETTVEPEDDVSSVTGAAGGEATAEPEDDVSSVTGAAGGEATAEPGDSGPLVLATTGIWADVVANLACGGPVRVESIMETGADPHAYEPSMADRARMEEAALVVANGLNLEEGLGDTLDAVAASGTPVFRVSDHVSTLDFASGRDHDEEGHDDHDDHDDEGHDDHDEEGHDDHDEEGHDDHDDHDEGHDDHDEEGHDDHDDHDDDHDEEGHDDHDEHDDHGHEGHAHSGADPHVWFDPVRVSGALDELAEHLTGEAGLAPDAVADCLSRYQAELAQLHDELVEILSAVPPAGRKLVTDHDALGYFADRYGFEVIATVIPSTSTMAETNPAALEELSETIAATGVRAVFAEVGRSTDTVEALVARSGPVEMAVLYTGSLGPPGSGADTYAGFMRTNARTIADALGGGPG